MIKRLLIVGAFTGIAHLTNIFILKYLANNISPVSISTIGEIDSLVILIVSIVSFGLQLSTTRKIALLEDWKGEYYATQSARLTLSLFLVVVGLTGFLITKNILFLFSPIFGLNGDYALYGRGKPQLGAFVSLLRVLIPAGFLLLASIYWIEYISVIYILSILFSYILASIIVSKSLGVSYFIKPKILNLKKYWLHFGLGIASVLYLFIGVSLINVVSFIYPASTIADIYLILKFYMVFKGVRQIMVHSFYKELIQVETAFKVDQLASISGLVLLTSLAFFLDVIAPAFFRNDFINYSTTFVIIGLAGFFSSFTTSTGSRLLLVNKDKQFIRNITISAGLTIFLSIFFYYTIGNELYLIALSIMFGELLLSILDINSINEKEFIFKRLKAIFPYIIIALLFIAINLLFNQSTLTFITFLIVLGITVLFQWKKQLNGIP